MKKKRLKLTNAIHTAISSITGAKFNYEVRWTSKVQKQLNTVPFYIKEKFYYWAFAVQSEGIAKVRTRSGFHDEPLQGNLKGVRSIRLNKAYRVLYVENKSSSLKVIQVIEVNKHEY